MSLGQLASFRVQSGGSAVGRMLLQMDLGLEHLGSSEIQPEMVEDTAIGPDLSHQLHSYLAWIAWYCNLKSSAGKIFQSRGNSMFSRVEPFGSDI